MILKKSYRGYVYLYGSWHYMGTEVAHVPTIAKIHFRKRAKKAIDTVSVKVEEVE